MQQLFDSTRNSLRLGSKIGSGGEGAVFDIIGRPNDVAKIYHKAMDPERAQKIAAMASMGSPELSRMTAWPTDLIRDGSAPVGLIMPKIANHKDIHKLYSPKSRKHEFPKADFSFLVHAAANIARAFVLVHAKQCVIGDVNHGSVTVARDATAKLIDCDSFQIEAGGKTFLCTVGVPTFTPPELQGRPFAGVVRTSNHDNFGLAILIFHLLFLGRHPFAGRFTGRGDMPIETAIQQSRFAYGSERQRVQMEPPPNVPPIQMLDRGMADLFERAFGAHASNGTQRPTAQEWVQALGKLAGSLSKCPSIDGHIYPSASPSCPWCPIENSTGVMLFHVVLPPTTPTKLDIGVIWRRIEAIKPPLLPPPLPQNHYPNLSPSSEAEKAARKQRIAASRAKYGNIVLCIVVLGLCIAAPAGWFAWLVLGYGAFKVANPEHDNSSIQRFKTAADQGEKRHRDILLRYEALRGVHTGYGNRVLPSSAAFDNLKRRLQTHKDDYLCIPKLRQAKLAEIESNKRQQQLDAFLGNFYIAHASISGIGPGRKVTLESYGIETAADVVEIKILGVPGFGPSMTKKLLEWRRGQERKFRFNPSKAVDPNVILALDQEIEITRRSLEKALRDGVAELEKARRQLELWQISAKQELDASIRAVSQTRADWNLVQRR